MLRFTTLLVALGLVAVTVGCKKDPPKPPQAPSGPGGFVTNGSPGQRDSGSDEDSGGPVDAAIEVDASAITAECEGLNPGDFINGDTGPDGMLLTGVSFPADFAPTRVLATWEASCVEPTILIELSDGKCPDGRSHKLQILLDANAIDGPTPTILVGLNTLAPEPDDKGIRIRYLRPMSVSPHGEWGSCAGAPGTFEFVGEPATTAHSQLQARFALSLAACDGSDAIDEIVRGSFNVVLHRGREDVCPTK